MYTDDEIHQKIAESLLSRGPVLVESESESLYFKEVLFKEGRKVVSDRDVFTLDYELTRHMSQTKGLRVLDDALYPFTKEASERDFVKQSMEWAKHFPDPFIEEELAQVLMEFLGQEKDCAPFLKQLNENIKLFENKSDFKSVPRAYSNIFLNELEFPENSVFMKTLIDDLPFSFSDKYQEKSLSLGALEAPWGNQIELYDVFEKDDSLQFQNYEHQLDEVRSVLKCLSQSEDPEKILVLYPKHSGYEKLFYLYQREFFDQQIVFSRKQEKTTIHHFINELEAEISSVKTYYDAGFSNKNKIIFGEVSDSAVTLDLLSKKYFGANFTEKDLNVFSHIMAQLGSNQKLLLGEWKSIFEAEMSKSKIEKIQSSLHLKDYSYLPNFKPNEIWILGWGDHLFKKTGERLFSDSILSRLELDLGLDLPSLKKSHIRQLLKNPLLNDRSVLKRLCYSHKNLSGSSNQPGVFKILKEASVVGKKTPVPRIKKQIDLNLSKSKIDFKSRGLSASSLQKYEECPYQFYLEKVIGLENKDEEDYFLSAKEEGSLIHKVLEQVVNNNLTKDMFLELLKSLIAPQDEDFNSFRQGAFSKLSQKLWSIISDEKKYIEEREILTVFVEKFFCFDVDVESKSFKEKGAGDYSIRGVVDRLDVNQEGQAFLYDYKRGDSGSHSLSRYTGSKLAPQLFLYCLAADRGFLGDFQKFVGFQYINTGSYKRMKGFVDKENGKLMAKEVPHGSLVDAEKYNEKIDIFLDKFWTVLARIKKAQFEERPNPLYSGTCESCQWVGVCKKSETFL